MRDGRGFDLVFYGVIIESHAPRLIFYILFKTDFVMGADLRLQLIVALHVRGGSVKLAEGGNLERLSGFQVVTGGRVWFIQVLNFRREAAEIARVRRPGCPGFPGAQRQTGGGAEIYVPRGEKRVNVPAVVLCRLFPGGVDGGIFQRILGQIGPRQERVFSA